MDDWELLGEGLASTAAAASWGDGEVQIFAVTRDGHLWSVYWDGEAWHEPHSLGQGFTGQPGASARDADRIDVFAVDTAGALRHRWWNGTEWVPWETVAGAPSDVAAVACSWSGSRLDVFTLSGDGTLRYRPLEG